MAFAIVAVSRKRCKIGVRRGYMDGSVKRVGLSTTATFSAFAGYISSEPRDKANIFI